MLRKNAGFTLVAVLTLALGIAVNTTVFSWIDAVLLNPLPGVANPDRIALIETVTSDGEFLVNTSYLDYRDYRDNLQQVTGVAIGRFTPLSVGADGETERAWAELVSANFFEVLGVKPVLGRTFLPEEGGDKPGAYPVAVLSYGMWQKRFQGDPKVLGKTIRLNRQNLTIVGVAPREFHGTTVGLAYDVWIPITMAIAMGTGNGTLTFRGTRDLTSTIIRLKPGVTIEQARAEVSSLAKRLAEANPSTNRGIDATVVPVWKGHLGAQGMLLKPLQILTALCVLMLLIVCANVANLLLARAVSRQKEFSVRLALGSGRSRLVRQLFTETLLLAGAGALAGIVMVMWMGQSLLALLPIEKNIPLDVGGGVNGATFGFSLLLAVVATLVSGTAPALLSVRTKLNEVLKEGGRGGSAGTHSHRLRGLLVVSEVALATLALVGAGLFLRSFRNACGIEPGFDMDNVSVSYFYLSSAGYSAQEQRQFCRTLRERMETMPGVVGMTYSDVVPMTAFAGSSPWHQLDIEGYVPSPGDPMLVHRATVPPGYFDLFGIRLLSGRDFTSLDDEKAPLVIIVNEVFAKRFYRGANPVGRKVRVGNNNATIVGLVRDSKYHTPIEAPTPYFFIPFQQWFAPGLNFNIFLKTMGDPMRMDAILRREALALNQDAMFESMTLAEATMASLFPQRVAANLLAVVGALCVLLAASGLYSVLSYAVSQRKRELAVRMAVGARPGDVLALVVFDGLKLTLPGLVVGFVAALALSRLVSGMLVMISAFDPLTFVAVALFLGVIVLAATSVPALRAARIDPMQALRCE